MNTLESDLVNHEGSCHCGKIKFSVQASRKLLVYTCKYKLFILNSIYISLIIFITLKVVLFVVKNKIIIL
jgi:hypothetical protein